MVFLSFIIALKLNDSFRMDLYGQMTKSTLKNTVKGGRMFGKWIMTSNILFDFMLISKTWKWASVYYNLKNIKLKTGRGPKPNIPSSKYNAVSAATRSLLVYLVLSILKNTVKEGRMFGKWIINLNILFDFTLTSKTWKCASVYYNLKNIKWKTGTGPKPNVPFSITMQFQQPLDRC